MVKGAPSSIGTAANVSTAADVRQASVQFPLAGDLDAGLGNVRVIDWNRPGLSARMTQTGPIAHQLGLDEEIETTIRTERMCGGCPASATDGQLMVEVMLGKRQSISGSSYTLALALADKIARGSLPLLADRTIVASGHVQRNGQVAPVGRLAEKLEVIARALARATISAPLLILPQANLAALTDAEQRLLDAVIAAGARSEGGRRTVGFHRGLAILSQSRDRIGDAQGTRSQPALDRIARAGCLRSAWHACTLPNGTID